MQVVNFRFTKISIEKFGNELNELKVNTNININSIEPFKLKSDKDKELFEVSFMYSIVYNETFAKLEFEGKLLLSLDKIDAEELLKNWEDKKIPENIRFFLLNAIFRKSNIKALDLEDQINIPPHIPFQTIVPEKNTEQ